MANEPIRRHRTGKSARHGRTCAGAWIAAKLEVRNCVDQQSSHFLPHEFRSGRLPFVSLVSFVVPPVSALLRGSASPRESFVSAAKLEIRDCVDQQSSRLAPQELEIRDLVDQHFSPRAARPAYPQSAGPRLQLKPKNSFADALTRYLKTSYGEKTDFCNTPRPKGGEGPFRNSLSRKNLQLCKNAQNPRRLRKTILRPAASRYNPPNINVSLSIKLTAG
jgi:hypothetical protein